MIMVKELVIQDSQCSWRIVNLIAGVWVPDDPDAIAVAMAWSPLKQISGGVQIEIKEQACRYVFEKLGNAVQSLHEVTKELWKKKWPKLCRKFVIRGKGSLGCMWSYNNILQVGALQRTIARERT